ncbi:MAG: T9SS type A sorting domain-containing protein, partial [Candidatus Zixiibacteriota bacterium]
IRIHPCICAGFGADFDGDTDIDLAVANYYSDNVSILYNLTYTPSDTLIIDLDIKPGSCPNPLNIKHKGMYAWTEDKETENPIAASMTSPYDTDKRGAVVPVAILGTEDFDVADIDVATVELEGVGPIRWNYEDVATPVDDTTACACTTLGPDGFDDLTLKFDRAAIIVALGEVHDGDVIPLTITGELNDGTPFEGTDCVVIIGDRETMDGDTDSEVTPEVELLGNHPNPFNPVTEISFSLPDAVHVKLEIFNVMGQKVATVVDRFMEAGKHTVQWDAASFSSGVYFYRLTASDFVETKKMMLLK